MSFKFLQAKRSWLIKTSKVLFLINNSRNAYPTENLMPFFYFLKQFDLDA